MPKASQVEIGSWIGFVTRLRVGPVLGPLWAANTNGEIGNQSFLKWAFELLEARASNCCVPQACLSLGHMGPYGLAVAEDSWTADEWHQWRQWYEPQILSISEARSWKE